ncbi:hypothetical protein AALP_AA8G247400 [Arabis alpina]|uniref:MADS-box domain-containing protein n=1 Tax=Arabis alpina TaxID=50452 RepID=A0A087G980_ARAAL|nr:hypothetical protein AALP_AA8G247400 [Arabis alpina]
MTRQKLKLAFIESESARKSTFKKRKRGILKKAEELAILCDVPICMRIDSPYDPNPEVWPSEEKMSKIVSDWKMLSVMDKTKKMVNLETFLQQRITKEIESWRKLRKENREREMKEVMFDCIKGKTSVSQIAKTDLPDLACVIDQCLKDLNHRIEVLNKNGESSSSSAFVASTAATTPSNAMSMVEMRSSSVEFYNKIREQIEKSLNMETSIKDLDLNQKQMG